VDEGVDRLPGLVDDYLAGKLTVDDYVTHRVRCSFPSLLEAHWRLTVSQSASTGLARRDLERLRLQCVSYSSSFRQKRRLTAFSPYAVHSGGCIRCVVDMWA